MNHDENMRNKVRIEYKPLSQCLAVFQAEVVMLLL